jgi:hypothetical protein
MFLSERKRVGPPVRDNQGATGHADQKPLGRHVPRVLDEIEGDPRPTHELRTIHPITVAVNDRQGDTSLSQFGFDPVEQGLP